MSRPIALVDLDGTLADFDKAMRRDLTLLQGNGEASLLRAEDEDVYPHIQARRTLIKRSPNWWFNLEPIQRGFRVVQMLRDLGYQLHVCTKASLDNSGAWEQKVRWCREHIPDALINITQDKSLQYGRVLMDDWPKYVAPWLEVRKRGIVILPDQPWNQDYQHVRAYRHREDNDLAIYEVLKKHRALPLSDAE